MTFVFLDGIVRRGLRHIWDAFMFHAVIKKRGRIPASDSCLVRRIAGPGLHSNFYYQVSLVSQEDFFFKYTSLYVLVIVYCLTDELLFISFYYYRIKYYYFVIVIVFML